MIQPNTQLTIFNTKKSDALKIANTTESFASQWYNQKYLSFDISRTPELQNSEVLELAFISKLFNSALSLDTINQLLSLLTKPYAYDFRKIYFDIFSNKWSYLPKKIDEEEITNSYIENLTAENDHEEIERLIDNLQDLLK
jgi:hypothetical protein